MKKNTRIILKAVLIGALLLLMLIPLAFVKSAIKDRLKYKEEAEGKITASWGGPLEIAAPVLNVPYSWNTTEKVDGKEVVRTHRGYRKIAPETLAAEAEITPQLRAIGIFEVPVFTARIKMTGSFAPLAEVNIADPKSFITLELSSLKGLSSTPALIWDGKEAGFEIAQKGEALQYAEKNRDYYYDSHERKLKMLSAPAPSKNAQTDFELNFEIRGSSSIAFIPLAKDTVITMRSSWPHPNFLGSFLPEERTVSDEGFSAQWRINNLASGIPQLLSAGASYPSITATLTVPVDNYRNSERAVKYGVLFIALTFLACFVFEIAGKKPVHPFQYALVGLALAVFYLLLTALSEFISFGVSYLFSASAVITMLTLYIRYGIVRARTKKIFYAAAGFAALYAYLYVLLQLEDMALIFGTAGLFAGLAFVMYTTRSINWYEE